MQFEIGKKQNYNISAINIHAGNTFSGMTCQSGDLSSREMYGWGGKNMLDMVSMSSTVKGEDKFLDGVHLKGNANNISGGVFLIDKYDL